MYSQLYVKREAANMYFIFVSQLESSLPSQNHLKLMTTKFLSVQLGPF